MLIKTQLNMILKNRKKFLFNMKYRKIVLLITNYFAQIFFEQFEQMETQFEKFEHCKLFKFFYDL